MKDVITYCPDINALRSELVNLNRIDDDQQPVLHVTKTPTQRSGDKTLSLVRLVTEEDEQQLQLSAIEVLGTYEEVFVDPDKMAKYTSVYSIEPYEIEDEDGNKQMVAPPKKFGVFYD